MPERKKFLEEMSIVAEAASSAFESEKMNSDECSPSETELTDMKKKLLVELEKLV